MYSFSLIRPFPRARLISALRQRESCFLSAAPLSLMVAVASMVVVASAQTPPKTGGSATAKSPRPNTSRPSASASAKPSAPSAQSGPLQSAVTLPPVPAVISELRTYGPQGDDDSFIEISNTTSEPLDMGGWSVQFLNPKKQLVVISIRAGITIPSQGHLLLVGKRYSLKAYASGDIELSGTIAGGVRLCDAQGQTVDAVGPQTAALEGALSPTTVVAQVFGEGRGLLPLAFESATLHEGSKTQFSCVRRHRIGQSALQDTNDNAADFFVVSVDGTLDENQVRLGAPGPQNLAASRLDYPLRPQTPAVQNAAAPKTTVPAVTQTKAGKDDGIVMHASSTQSGKLPRLRSTNASGANQQYGTLTLRYRLVNETKQTLKRFSLSVIGMTAGPNPKGTADLRFLTPTGAKRLAARDKDAASLPAPGAGSAMNASLDKAADGSSNLPVFYGILDEPPAQKNGGGLNSSLTFEVPQGIAPGTSVELRFLLGVEARGRYQVTLDGVGLTATFDGNTETGDGVWQATTRSGSDSYLPREAMNNSGTNGASGNGGGSGSGRSQGSGVGKPQTPNPTPERVLVASIIVSGNTEDETDPPSPKSPLNLSSSAADSATNVITLRFTGPLNTGSAGTAANYSVSNQDGAIRVEQASYSEGDQSVTLRLPEGSLHRGDMVTLQWHHLKDAQGREINGQVGPIKVY